VIDAAEGSERVDVALATGAYPGRGTRGWKRSKNGKTWTFVDQTDAPANGIVKRSGIAVARSANEIGAPGQAGRRDRS
jgi:hypothetical protein